MELSTRMKQYRELYGWTQDDLANASGLSLSSIKKYEANISENFTFDNLKKISAAFNVTPSDFINDELSVDLSVNKPKKNVRQSINLSANMSDNLSNLKKTEADQISHDQILIRKLSSAVGAGESVDINGVEVYDTDVLVPFSQMLFKVRPKKIDRIRCMQVDGYSMVPMLFPDSWVIADVTAKFEGDGLYIINYCDNFMVKLLQKSPDGTLHIKSVNKDYESYDIGPDDDAQVYIVGKVLRRVI
ncbi:LexA family transcriptional regulator [uncultured Campylobacter sp.]|uniref:XRE family transcriptional regulator n=1 Tax=uncultured Campylobacter sp. TaxID=218934 RepID=UPI0028F0D9DA|nr:LexA family transcriptional regulator [uncultured Campylobacter sp.]